MHIYASPVTKHLAFVQHLTFNGCSRTQIATLAIGKAAADQLPLPNRPSSAIPTLAALHAPYQDAAVTHFRHALETGLRLQLAALNEYAVLDMEAIVDAARNFYGMRWAFAFPEQRMIVTATGTEESALLGFFGISRHVSPATVTYISINGQQISQLYNEAVQFFADVTVASLTTN